MDDFALYIVLSDVGFFFIYGFLRGVVVVFFLSYFCVLRMWLGFLFFAFDIWLFMALVARKLNWDNSTASPSAGGVVDFERSGCVFLLFRIPEDNVWKVDCK
jgi:hypothetical protein